MKILPELVYKPVGKSQVVLKKFELALRFERKTRSVCGFEGTTWLFGEVEIGGTTSSW